MSQKQKSVNVAPAPKIQASWVLAELADCLGVNPRSTLDPGNGLATETKRVGSTEKPCSRALEHTPLINKVLERSASLGDVLVDIALRLADEGVLTQSIVLPVVWPVVGEWRAALGGERRFMDR